MYIQPSPSLTMKEAVQSWYENKTNFKGRARRSEYWKTTLCVLLINMAYYLLILLLYAVLGDFGAVVAGILSFVYPVWTIFCFIATLAMSVRRLHDTGKSGWWYLLGLTGLGLIVLLVFFCMDSTEDNKWGPNPKY